jgi:RHS repeat-associated protein
MVDLSDLPILDTDAEGKPTMSYVQGPGGLIEQRSGETTSFALRDAHGDITTLADGEGEVASRQTYDPWGDQLAGPSLEMGWLGAQQRRSDGATGLVQMGIRSYDPTLGAFLTEDPVLGHVGVGMTTDRYLYALSNPLNRYDLNGRDVCVFGGCVGPDDVAAIGEDIEGGLGIAEEGVNAVGSATGSAADDAWDWTAPGREWTSDRAQDFWKAHGGTLESVYTFAGKHWQECSEV